MKYNPQSMKAQRTRIHQEIQSLRQQNKAMWRELVDAPNVRFVINEEARKRQLDLNAKFRKNEARLKRLHEKLDIDWIPTTEMTDSAFGIVSLTLFVATLAFIAFVIGKAIVAFY